MKKRLIIDTDGVSDDVRAIVLALRQDPNQVEVVAITTVSGCVSVDQVIANVSRTMRLVRKKVPIYRGADRALVQSWQNNELSEYFFGKDGIGDCPHEHPQVEADDFTSHVADKAAAIALTELVAQYSGELTIVSLGPLTNVALAIKLDNNFGKHLKDIFIMGGNYYGIGNVSERSTAEYNFHGDPEAAHIVLTELQCPITCVPWEAFFLEGVEHQKRIDFHAHLNYSNNPISRYLSMATSIGRQRLEISDRQYAYCDEIAVAAAIRPDDVIQQSQLLRARVELNGQMTRGQIAIDWLNVFWKPKDVDGDQYKPNVRFITSYNVDVVDQMIHDVVTKQHDD